MPLIAFYITCERIKTFEKLWTYLRWNKSLHPKADKTTLGQSVAPLYFASIPIKTSRAIDCLTLKNCSFVIYFQELNFILKLQGNQLSIMGHRLPYIKMPHNRLILLTLLYMLWMITPSLVTFYASYISFI